MTRVLAELLGAREPMFSRSLRQLEILAGHPGVDIRLASDMQQAVQAKLRQLGLDARDTTGPELYAVLGEKLKADEKQFVAAVQQNSKPARDDVIASVTQAIQSVVQPLSCFAIKSAVAKRLLRTNLPRKTMKLLGYRSVDSMLKHETAATLFAAAWVTEPDSWAKRIIASYAKLQAADFEVREITIEHPASARWQTFAHSITAAKMHAVLSFKELGTVVLLPLPAGQQHSALPALQTAVQVVHGVNEIRAAGTFLKLHQMQSDFGAVVQQVVLGEPLLPSEELDQPVPWNILHQYFARRKPARRTDMFEPVVTAEELSWASVESVISRIAPSLSFWDKTAHLALMHGDHPVSCNLTDAILSHSHQSPFSSRSIQHFRQSLRSELFLQYLSQDRLEQTVLGNLQRKLAPEMVMI